MPGAAQAYKSDRQAGPSVSVIGSEACQRNHVIVGINITVFKGKIKNKIMTPGFLARATRRMELALIQTAQTKGG